MEQARSQGVTVWLTGRPASGKTTIAVALEIELRRRNYDPRRFDGDDLRRGPSRDLGFSRVDRAESGRRAAGYAAEVNRDGGIAIVSLISPYAADRQAVRALHESEKLPFVEVHVHCPQQVAEARDPKRLYARARAGEIHGVTGIDDPYEAPERPEVLLDTSRMTVAEEIRILIDWLAQFWHAPTRQ